MTDREMSDREVADDVLAHSADEGEWDETPVAIETRANGTQVISARLPSDLAHRVVEEAATLGIPVSDFVRMALERHLQSRAVVAVMSYHVDASMRFLSPVHVIQTINTAVTGVAPEEASPDSELQWADNPFTSIPAR